MKVKVLILTGYGINADKELLWAFELAGGDVKIVHIEDVIQNKKMVNDYQIIAFPGGFSFGDHIVSGKVFANIVKHNFFHEIKRFIESDKLIIGICNGFQIITRLGLVPDIDGKYSHTVSLIENDSGKFEDRWVFLKTKDNPSYWLKDIDSLYLPIRHGEGKFVVKDKEVLDTIISNRQVGLEYFNPKNEKVLYPYNPNGAINNIAAITNKKGNVLGLMPHPEAYIFKEHHPRWTEGITEKWTGLKIFQNGLAYFK